MTTTLEIRGYHCDAYGYVNPARWLELFDEARWAFWQEHDYQWFTEHQYSIVVGRIEVDYLRPAKPGDVIDIESTWDSFEGDAAWLVQNAKRDGKLVATALVKLAIVPVGSNKALKIEGELLEMLA